jgi:hypothetical protein
MQEREKESGARILVGEEEYKVIESNKNIFFKEADVDRAQ